MKHWRVSLARLRSTLDQARAHRPAGCQRFSLPFREYQARVALTRWCQARLGIPVHRVHREPLEHRDLLASEYQVSTDARGKTASFPGQQVLRVASAHRAFKESKDRRAGWARQAMS